MPLTIPVALCYIALAIVAGVLAYRATWTAGASLAATAPFAWYHALGPTLVTVSKAAFVGSLAGLLIAALVRPQVRAQFRSALRGDIAPVTVGARSNIQDGTVVHVADDGPCEIGADVVVGHRAMLHACRVEDACLVGMQATVLDQAVIGAGSVVGAGALVTQRTVIPPRSLVLGAPAKVIRTLTAEDEAFHRALAAKYVRLKENYLRDALRAG